MTKTILLKYVLGSTVIFLVEFLTQLLVPTIQTSRNMHSAESDWVFILYLLVTLIMLTFLVIKIVKTKINATTINMALIFIALVHTTYLISSIECSCGQP